MHAAARFIQGGRDVNSLMAVLEPEAVVFQSAAKTSQEIVLILARKLERLGYVRPSFVDAVFLLAINDKDQQIETLQTIIATIQDAAAMRALKCARTLAEIKSVFG